MKDWKVEYEKMRGTYHYLLKMLRHKADRIAELEKQSEPVAWVFDYGTDKGDAVNEVRWYSNLSFKRPDQNGLIRNLKPLYTTPQTKPLSDEEIMSKADETCLTAWIAINPIMDVESQKETAKKRMIDFARAILRKAQVK